MCLLTGLVTSIVSGLRSPLDQRSSDSDSDSSTNSSQSTVQSSNADSDPLVRRPPWTELQQLQHSINTYISGLYRISVVIRKNRNPLDKVIKSANIDISSYEFYDQRHVLEKFPFADPDLITRLGKAVSQRRKYLKYRERHRQKLSLHPNVETPSHAKQILEGAIARADQAASLTQGPEISSHEQRISTVASTVKQPSSTLDSTAASTFLPMNPVVQELDHGDQISETATQTSHGSTSSVQQHTLTIPPPPQSSLEGLDFECPYCYTICRLVTVEPWQQRREWRQHVLRDLQPYLCTFGGCSEANTLYERRRDWIAHELQSHRNEWCCNASGHQPYDNRNDFKDHMIREHSGSFKMDGLDALTDMVARPAVNMKSSCPLNCSEKPSNLTIDRLERHLGRHLEVIATFALPSRGTETPQSYGSNVTRDANSNGSASSGLMQLISDDAVSASHADDDGGLSLQDPIVGSSNGRQQTYKDIQDCINKLISDLESSYRYPLPTGFPAKTVQVVSSMTALLSRPANMDWAARWRCTSSG